MKKPGKRRSKKQSKGFTVAMYCMAIAVLAVAGVFAFQNIRLDITLPTSVSSQTSESTLITSRPREGRILSGIQVGGVDVSGMTAAEALAAAQGITEDVLGKIRVLISVDGQEYDFAAKELGITTDIEEVVAQALAYGHTGTPEERQQAARHASVEGACFSVRAVALKEKLTAALLPLKESLDVAAVDAAVTFMPWGYTKDGKPYVPDVNKLAEAVSAGKSLARPDLVRIGTEEMPNPRRYQYWFKEHKIEGYYVKNYIPADANISRFVYDGEQNGKALDIDELAGQIVMQVESGQYATIKADMKTVEPAVKLEDLKKSTQLISSWSSSYHTHSTASRDWNVSRMSSFINGCVILPGEQWSVNQTAGPRDPETAVTIGWRKAAGILRGGYTDQFGGGVCQLGSTTFNAAIRAGITVVSAAHHTIPSDYVPLGLDATLSTPGPDLILQNDGTMPIYIVSYLDPEEQNVTVEIYGQLPEDPKYGRVIYDFTSDNRGVVYGEPTMTYIFNTTVIPEDKTIVLSAENPVYEYAKLRYGVEIQTFKHIYSLDGQALCSPIPYEHHQYKPINGKTYVFGPALPTPSPTPPPPTAAPSETSAP